MILPDGYSDVLDGKVAAVVAHLEMTARPALPRSGFRPFRRQIVSGDDPRLDGTAPRDAAKHVPVIE
jgi:hypothetical protein